MNKTQFKSLAFIAMLQFCILASAQSGGGQISGGGTASGTPPRDPQYDTKMNAIIQIQIESRKKIAIGQYDEAIELANSCIPKYHDLKIEQFSTPFWLIAESEVAKNNYQRARESLKNGAYWNEFDIGTNGEGFNRYLGFYARVLHSVGEIENAKAILYADIRSANHLLGAEDGLPLIDVVFDEALGGDFWDLTAHRMEVATKTIEVIWSQDSKSAKCDELISMWPEWYYPYLVKATKVKSREAKIDAFDQALIRARTLEQKRVIEILRPVVTDHPKREWFDLINGQIDYPSRLNSSGIYEPFRLRLVENWERVAVKRVPLPNSINIPL